MSEHPGRAFVTATQSQAALRSFRARRVFASIEFYRVIRVLAPPAGTSWHGQIRRILAEVATARDVSDLDILSPRRDRFAVRARQEVMYRAATETPASLSQIARVLDRDPTSVLHGVRAHRRRIGVVA
jgi:chromosomal replication initiation ATPase DnaA